MVRAAEHTRYSQRRVVLRQHEDIARGSIKICVANQISIPSGPSLKEFTYAVVYADTMKNAFNTLGKACNEDSCAAITKIDLGVPPRTQILGKSGFA